MEYSLDVKELLERHIIRNDQLHEFMNKMTDEELKKFHREIQFNLDNDEIVLKKFPDYNAEYMAKIIDRSILYDIFKLK